jgi:uncharacterized protein (DUF1778 family)
MPAAKETTSSQAKPSQAKPARKSAAKPRETLNLRIQPELRALIDRAAELTGRTRTSFVLDAARQLAEETMLEQTVFKVDQATYDQFVSVLDRPPAQSERLRKLLAAKAPWSE